LPAITPERQVSDVLSALNREQPRVSLEQLSAAITQMVYECVSRTVVSLDCLRLTLFTGLLQFRSLDLARLAALPEIVRPVGPAFIRPAVCNTDGGSAGR
jgi:hypothetical protein